MEASEKYLEHYKKLYDMQEQEQIDFKTLLLSHFSEKKLAILNEL